MCSNICTKLAVFAYKYIYIEFFRRTFKDSNDLNVFVFICILSGKQTCISTLWIRSGMINAFTIS